MKNRFFLKIFSGYLALIFFFLVFSYFITIKILKNQQMQIISENIQDVVDTVETASQNFYSAEKQKKFEEYIYQVTKKTDVRITIISLNGTVIMDSEKDPSFMENHSDRPEFRQAVENGYGKSIRWSPTLETYMVYYAKKSGNSVIRGSLHADDVSGIISDGKRNFARISWVLLLTGLMFSLIFSRLLYSPVKEILVLTENLRYRKQTGDSIPKRKDEIGEIMKNIIDFASRTSQLEEKEKFVAGALKQFINTMDFPVAILNVEGDINTYNAPFGALLEIEKKQGLWWEKIKHFEINRLIKETIEDKEKLEREVRIKDNYFLCKSILLNENKEILLILVDITQIKNIEERRKEFLTAVSHELKTPLTAIKGYIETLKEEITDSEKRKYIDIVAHNTERMAGILEDLITLSQLEKTDVKVDIQDVDISKVVKNVVLLFEKKATDKGLALQFKDKVVPLIKGNEFRLEQMLINLVDNAIRFTERGKIEISLDYQKETKAIKIQVADTGIGIEKQHLSRIFEKFYVADKARSRHTGGTGLGLSIVKSIVSLHNGNIEVESTPGKGTKFIITLPV